MAKISVVISAYNEEKNIEHCLKSVKGLADEIIVVDNSSLDQTTKIAEKYADKVYRQENDPSKIDLQKNFGFSKATGDWVLSLDADEYITEELASEIKQVIDSGADMNGYKIPRKNIIFGKWIEHTGWYPDYQLRLFKRGKGKFVHAKVHEPLFIEGEVAELLSPINHNNYQSINQFLSRMIVYTDSEANAVIDSGHKFSSVDVLRMPFNEFLRRFFTQEGYKDGLHGLALSLLMSFYHLVVVLKVWEKNKFEETEKDSLGLFSNEAKRMNKEISYWIADKQIEEMRDPIKKTLTKLSRKLNSSRREDPSI